MTFNAFERNEASIPEVKEQVIDPQLDMEIARLEAGIKSLRAMNLHHTAQINQRKLDRLLRKRQDPEGG